MHAVSLLKNGNVVVTGVGSGYYLNNTELFHPYTWNWTNGATLDDGRYMHAAVTLQNGKVLVLGGINDALAYSNTAELYDSEKRN